MKTSGKQIALRYVRALFAAADERTVPKIEADLNALAEMLKDEEAHRLLLNPVLSTGQQAAAVAMILKKLKADSITEQFLELLAHRKRLSLLPEIAPLFSDMAAEARGELKGEIISATPLKASDTDKIAAELSQAYGKKIQLAASQDKSLLGGIVIKIGGMRLDASLAGKLNRLSQKLKTA